MGARNKLASAVFVARGGRGDSRDCCTDADPTPLSPPES
jgi:hypothetical protein